MKQKILILTSLMLLLVGSMNCYGFCIYNYTKDLEFFNAIQKSGGTWFGSFGKNVYKGEKQCCGWDDHGCNKSDRRDGIVEIHIVRNGTSLNGVLICDPKIKAYQDIMVSGSNGNYKCSVIGY